MQPTLYYFTTYKRAFQVKYFIFILFIFRNTGGGSQSVYLPALQGNKVVEMGCLCQALNGLQAPPLLGIHPF